MYNNPLPFFMSKSYTTKREREKKTLLSLISNFWRLMDYFTHFIAVIDIGIGNKNIQKTRYVSQVIDKPYQIKTYRVHLVRIELISLMVM